MDRHFYGGNLYVDTINQRKRLVSATTPSIQRAKESYTLGGGFFSFALPYEVEDLEFKFSLNGHHEDVRTLVGREPGDWTTFYWYERLRDVYRGENYGRIVIVKGLLTAVEPSQMKGVKSEGTDYTVGSVIDYRDIMNGQMLHQMDVENNRLVMNGIDYSRRHNELIVA